MRELRLFGLRLVVESNDERVASLAQDLFDGPTHDDDGSTDGQIGDRPLRFRAMVEADPDAPTLAPAPGGWQFPDADHAVFTAPGAEGTIDMAAACCVTRINERVLESDGGRRFAHDVLLGPILMLPTRRDRHPVHAAALRRGNRALVLHGPSGAGKSTLAYVASRAGIDVLSDDSIRVQRWPALRVWGGSGQRSRHVHLCEDIRERYTELRDRDLVPVAARRVKYAVPVSRPSGHLTAPLPSFVEHVRVCLLSRERGTIDCEPVSAKEISRVILEAPEAACDLYEPGRRPAAEALAAAGGWRLHLSRDPEEALPLIQELLRQV